MRQSKPAGKPLTYVVACDTKSDAQAFSGSTYHLALQGVQDGLMSGMVNLHPRGVAAWPVYARAGWWKLGGGLRGRHGFKFTNAFLDGIWKQRLPALRGSRVINNFQLFGSHFLTRHRAFGIVPYCYIDATLGEYFENYGDFDAAQIDDAAKREALVVERAGYACCAQVFVMSRRTAAYIVERYEVPQSKIHIVPPGANIPESALASESRQERRRPPGKGGLVVGFIGLYPERKGLPKIAEAVSLLRQAGYDLRLHVIGNCPPEIARRDGVTYFGRIDKTVDIDRFIQIVGNVDIGCMLSRAELAGIALLEFLRLGVPIIATDVGGIPDIVGLGAGELVMPEISAADLAQRVARLVDQPGRLAELQESAWRRRDNASWRRVVRELRDRLDR